MSDNDTFLRMMAAWALVHETADEGWKAAVERGASQEPGSMSSGDDAFVDGLSAMIAEEKEKLKAALAAGDTDTAADSSRLVEHMDSLRFEVGELRGRVETLQASIDALVDRTDSE